MHNPLDLLILALATWRLSSLLTYERGPLWGASTGSVPRGFFERIRALAKVKHNAAGHPEMWPTTYFGELLTCVWCISPYVALALILAYHWGGEVVIWIALPFALSAAAIVINKQVR